MMALSDSDAVNLDLLSATRCGFAGLCDRFMAKTYRNLHSPIQAETCSGSSQFKSNPGPNSLWESVLPLCPQHLYLTSLQIKSDKRRWCFTGRSHRFGLVCLFGIYKVNWTDFNQVWMGDRWMDIFNWENTAVGNDETPIGYSWWGGWAGGKITEVAPQAGACGGVGGWKKAEFHSSGVSRAYGEKIRKNLKCTLKLSGAVEIDRRGEKTRPYFNGWTQTRPWESVLLQLNHWWAAYKWCKVNRRWNQNQNRSEKTNPPPGESENAESLSRGTRNATWVLLCCGETHSHSAE